MNRYISNVPGGKGSNLNAGTSVECPWLDFTPLHQTKLLPGDKILLERGSCWNQQLTLVDSGEPRHLGCAVDAYGTGPRPKIIRNGDPAERCIVLTNPSHWRIANVEVGHAGVGILVTYDTPNHVGLRFDNILAHHCYGIFTRDMPEGPARTKAIADRVFLSAGILITAAPMTLSPEQYVCRDIRFDNIEGTHNADSIALDPFNGDINGGHMSMAEGGEAERGEYAFRDVILNHLYLHDDDGPNPGGIPDSLRLFRCKEVTLLNSWLDRACGRYTTTGTAAVILVGVDDARFVNSMFTRTPDTNSPDQCGIDFECFNRRVKLRNNFFGYNAGPGVEFLDIHGDKAYSEDNEVTANAFEGNGWAAHGGQANSGGIHHYGENLATGLIRDNLVYEPDKPLYHGEFVGFELKHNLQAIRPLANSLNDFAPTQGEKGWRYQVRTSNADWQDLPTYDKARQVWCYTTDGKLAWISRFEQFAAESGTSVARAWQAPASGKLAIRGRALKTYAGGTQVSLRITQNGRELWSQPECSGSERDGYEAVLDDVPVAEGDIIRFEVGGPAGWFIDGVSWAPTLAYVG